MADVIDEGVQPEPMVVPEEELLALLEPQLGPVHVLRPREVGADVIGWEAETEDGRCVSGIFEVSFVAKAMASRLIGARIDGHAGG